MLPPPPRGKWRSEIKDVDTDHRNWLGFFQSVELTGRAYDKKAVAQYGSRAKINFPISSLEVPVFVDIDPQLVYCREVRESQEAHERLEAAHADEEYMAELRWMYRSSSSRSAGGSSYTRRGLSTRPKSGRPVRGADLK